MHFSCYYDVLCFDPYSASCVCPQRRPWRPIHVATVSSVASASLRRSNRRSRIADFHSSASSAERRYSSWNSNVHGRPLTPGLAPRPPPPPRSLEGSNPPARPFLDRAHLLHRAADRQPFLLPGLSNRRPRSSCNPYSSTRRRRGQATPKGAQGSGGHLRPPAQRDEPSTRD